MLSQDKPQIKVAFGSIPKDGGTYTFYRNIRPALHAHNIDMRCVSVGREEARLWEGAYADEGCHLLAPHSLSLKTQAKAFAAWCKSEEIDIVMGINSAAILSALPHLPQDVRVMSRCANAFDHGYKITMSGRERLTRIVALSPRLKDDLIADYGADPNKVVLIPNGHDAARFDEAAAQKRGAQPRLEMGFVGRLEHNQKGVLHLPEIISELDSLGVEYRLRIAGKGRHGERLREMLAPQCEAGRVVFLGALEPNEIPPFLGSLDLFVFTSKFEGMPNALLEAMMAGALPVCFNIPGITDFMITHGENGILVPQEHSKALALEIANLHADRPRIQAMSEAVAAHARAHFSAHSTAERYAALFAEIMREAPPFGRQSLGASFNRTQISLRHGADLCRRAFKIRSNGGGHDVPYNIQRCLRAPMKVYQVINHAGLDLGGAERLTRFLHLDLQSEGVEAHLIALQQCDLEGLPNAQSFGLGSPRKPVVFWKLFGALRGLRKGDAVIHVHLFPTTFFVSLLKQLGLISAPCLMTEHNTWNRRRASRLGRLLDRFIYRGFDRIVAISPQTKEALAASQPQLADRIDIITNGARLRFDKKPVRDLAPKVPTLLSIGRLAPQKNYPTVLNALAQIKDIPWTYKIAGGGAEEEALRAQIEALGLSDRVQLLGQVEDVTPLLEEADCFLMLSKWEGFGLAAVEAMNAGLPLVASDVPGLGEVVAATGCPLVSPDDPEDIAQEIRALLQDPARRAALGDAGFLHARNYGTSAMTQAYMTLWSRFAKELG